MSYYTKCHTPDLTCSLCKYSYDETTKKPCEICILEGWNWKELHQWEENKSFQQKYEAEHNTQSSEDSPVEFLLFNGQLKALLKKSETNMNDSELDHFVWLVWKHRNEIKEFLNSNRI